MAAGKTISATIATTYGCFWISFSIILIPAFGIQDAYENVAEYNHGMGCFMLVSTSPSPPLFHHQIQEAGSKILGLTDTTSLGLPPLLPLHNRMFAPGTPALRCSDRARKLHVAVTYGFKFLDG